MKKLTESLNFYGEKGQIIDAETFVNNLQNINGAEELLDKNQTLTKAINMNKENIKNSLNKILQVFAKNIKYEGFKEMITNNPNKFPEALSKRFVKFINNLPSSKEEDDYYSKFGPDAEYFKMANDKIWNNSMNTRDKQEWAKKFFKFPNLPNSEVADKLFKLIYGLIREGKESIDEKELNTLLDQVRNAPKPTATPTSPNPPKK